MNRVFGTDSVAYRVIAFASGSAWITVLWLVTSAPLVTAGPAAVALHDAAAALVRGDRYGWRDFARSVWRHRRAGFLTGLSLGVAWLACIAAAIATRTAPLAGGSLFVVAVMLSVASVLAPVAILRTAPGRGALRTMCLVALTQPGRSLLVTALWAAAAAGVLFLPFQYAVLVALLSPAGVASVSVLLLANLSITAPMPPATGSAVAPSAPAVATPAAAPFSSRTPTTSGVSR